MVWSIFSENYIMHFNIYCLSLLKKVRMKYLLKIQFIGQFQNIISIQFKSITTNCINVTTEVLQSIEAEFSLNCL